MTHEVKGKEQYTGLLRKRGSKYLSDLIGVSSQENYEIEEESVYELEQRLSSAISLLSEYEDFQIQIKLLVSDSEIDIQYQDRADFQSNYYTWTSKGYFVFRITIILYSSNLANILQLKGTHLDFKVVGLNLVTTKIEGRCQVKVQSHHTGFNTIISCLVISDITGKLPEYSFDISGLEIPKHIRNADPSFNKCSKIDMLLGADCFGIFYVQLKLSLE
ncbi:hypothetical protein NQ318_011847 [Aromia moschata]|uniref:Uncharacterized protein n=1 Tax=Aromia moschata TaxID=1265417 RepID=A0AAV8XFP0_9CUCU|nr:hypothetical protein NQ318_011847 [Aromia moschata]